LKKERKKREKWVRGFFSGQVFPIGFAMQGFLGLLGLTKAVSADPRWWPG
jgi:hypothetical protein